jgi:hypothetical protein
MPGPGLLEVKVRATVVGGEVVGAEVGAFVVVAAAEVGAVVPPFDLVFVLEHAEPSATTNMATTTRAHGLFPMALWEVSIAISVFVAG